MAIILSFKTHQATLIISITRERILTKIEYQFLSTTLSVISIIQSSSNLSAVAALAHNFSNQIRQIKCDGDKSQCLLQSWVLEILLQCLNSLSLCFFGEKNLFNFYQSKEKDLLQVISWKTSNSRLWWTWPSNISQRSNKMSKSTAYDSLSKS